MSFLNFKKHEQQAVSYVYEAIDRYNPTEIFVGFSGGTDSQLCLHLMKKHFPQLKAFHANTGIGIEKTRQFCRDHCKEHGVELIEIRAKEDCNEDYEELCMEYGFPGPAMHKKMYQRLKERPVRVLHRRYKQKWGGKILLLTGIRHDESDIRAGYADSIVDEVDGVVWVNPVYWFSKQEKYNWLKYHGIKPNPVSAVLGMSGECLCGAYAHKGELDLVSIVDPETADYIKALQERVLEKWPWGWEEGPQVNKPPADPEDEEEIYMPMCVGCGKTD